MKKRVCLQTSNLHGLKALQHQVRTWDNALDSNGSHTDCKAAIPKYWHLTTVTRGSKMYASAFLSLFKPFTTEQVKVPLRSPMTSWWPFGIRLCVNIPPLLCVPFWPGQVLHWQSINRQPTDNVRPIEDQTVKAAYLSSSLRLKTF